VAVVYGAAAVAAATDSAAVSLQVSKPRYQQSLVLVIVEKKSPSGACCRNPWTSLVI
jgi:hypothetical protein